MLRGISVELETLSSHHAGRCKGNKSIFREIGPMLAVQERWYQCYVWLSLFCTKIDAGIGTRWTLFFLFLGGGEGGMIGRRELDAECLVSKVGISVVKWEFQSILDDGPLEARNLNPLEGFAMEFSKLWQPRSWVLTGILTGTSVSWPPLELPLPFVREEKQKGGPLFV